MANQRLNYEDGTFPKKKVNKTIIFTNSERKSYVKNKSADLYHRAAVSNPKEIQLTYAENFTELSCSSNSQQYLFDRPSITNTLMDSTNASNNTLSSIPIVSPKNDINEPVTGFRFNFGSSSEPENIKPPRNYKPKIVPNKKNGKYTANLAALNTEEIYNTSSDFNSNAGNAITNESDGPNSSNSLKKGNDNHLRNVFKKYDNIDMNSIYPERLEGLLPPFGIQHRLGGVWYCLICDVKSLTFRTLKQHVDSEKHGNASESNRLKLNSYIDFWTAQPEECKKYQISFNIGVPKEILKCGRCYMKIKENNYIEHILICKPKKSKKYKNRSRYRNERGDENVREKVKNRRVVRDEAWKKKKAELNENAENVANADAVKVDGEVAVPSKNKKEKKKKPDQRVHEVTFQAVSSKWSKFIEGLSTRFDRHFKFFKKCNDDVFQCMACEIDIELDIVPVIVHLLTKEHNKKCGIYKIFWVYKCLVCDVDCISESEFWCHSNLDDEHKEKVQQLSEDRHESLGEYQCLSCKMIMFGDSTHIAKHVEAPIIKRKAKVVLVPTELDQTVKDLFKSRNHIESVALELLDGAKEVEDLNDQITEIIEDLETSLKRSFPKVKAYPFGSRITGICNKTSDLDIYVDIEANYFGERTVHRTSVIQQMKRLLFDNVHIWDDIFTIPAARTPIIQLRHIPTDIDIDLSFQNGLSVENTKFLRCCMEMQPQLRSLILLLKLWSTTTKFKPYLTTYALCMMAIFKMQIDGHLIPVSYLRQLNNAAAMKDNDLTPHNNQQFVTGWSIIDYRLSAKELQVYTVPITCDVFDLLKSFFEYYAAFDYNKMICPLLGEVINMDEWFEDNVSILPDEMDIYKEKVYNGLLQHNVYGYRYPITVQDPFDMSHILTRSINKTNLKVWRANCLLTFDYMTKL